MNWDGYLAKCAEIGTSQNVNQEVLQRSVWEVMDKYGMKESAESCKIGYANLKATALAGGVNELFVVGWIYDFGDDIPCDEREP